MSNNQVKRRTIHINIGQADLAYIQVEATPIKSWNIKHVDELVYQNNEIKAIADNVKIIDLAPAYRIIAATENIHTILEMPASIECHQLLNE